MHSQHKRIPPPPPLPHTDGLPPSHKKQRRTPKPLAIVLDIEGTVAPISYVADTLFPYAAQHLESHLQSTYDTPPTQRAIEALRVLGEEDSAAGREDAVKVPGAESAREEVIKACVESVKAQMAIDRKTTALKMLQV